MRPLTGAASGMVSDYNRTTSENSGSRTRCSLNSIHDMKSKYLTLLAGLSLLVPALFWALSARDMPSGFYPLPLLVLLPALFGLRQAAVAIPVILFFVWNPGLFHGEAAVPRRSLVLLLVATSLNLPWFVFGWNDGLAMQGARYNYSVSAVNAVFIATLWMLFARSRKTNSSFKSNLLFHWLLFAWLAWYAFPFFGELP
jgi:hypothetical protein